MAHTDLKALIEKILKFRDDRDWGQFHNPKDLALAISIEASELVELYLWKTKEEEIDSVSKEKVKEELADIFMFSFLLLDKMDFNLEQIINDKIKINNEKYPVTKSKGKSTKYNELK